MKKYLLILALVTLVMSCTRIDAGYTGLKIDLLGDDKGNVTEVPPGRYFNMSPNIDYKSFPLFVQNYKWTEGHDEGSPNDEAIRFQTKEGMLITADVGVTFTVNPEPGSARILFLSYRNGIEEIIDGPMRNAVRDAFNKFGAMYTADEIIGEGKTPLIASVTQEIKARFAPSILVDTISWLAAPRPPQQVIDALNAKVEATQKAIQRENEVRSSEAEAKKAVAVAQGEAEAMRIKAEAQAEANRIISASLTDRLIQQNWIEAWDGKLPTVSTDGNTSMIMDMRP